MIIIKGKQKQNSSSQSYAFRSEDQVRNAILFICQKHKTINNNEKLENKARSTSFFLFRLFRIRINKDRFVIRHWSKYPFLC